MKSRKKASIRRNSETNELTCKESSVHGDQQRESKHQFLSPWKRFWGHLHRLPKQQSQLLSATKFSNPLITPRPPNQTELKKNIKFCNLRWRSTCCKFLWRRAPTGTLPSGAAEASSCFLFSSKGTRGGEWWHRHSGEDYGEPIIKRFLRPLNLQPPQLFSWRPLILWLDYWLLITACRIWISV